MITDKQLGFLRLFLCKDPRDYRQVMVGLWLEPRAKSSGSIGVQNPEKTLGILYDLAAGLKHYLVGDNVVRYPVGDVLRVESGIFQLKPA